MLRSVRIASKVSKLFGFTTPAFFGSGKKIIISNFIKRYWLGVLIGCSGWAVTGIYLVEEYVETGSFSNLMVHLRAEMPLHHVVMMLLIPLMMILGFLFIRQGNLKEKMRVMSITDELTGLHNRRGFFTLAYQQLKMAKRLNRETLLLSADMDNLKEINDTLGHKEGDRALIDTAIILRKTFRESDIIARIGGDEFMVLQIESNDGGSGMVADRLKKNLETHNAKNENNFSLSLSVGRVYYDPSVHHSLDELMVCVDKKMYDQKKHKKKS